MEPVGPPPRPGMRDLVRTAADGAINLVPFVGGTASVLLHRLLVPSLERRTNRWLTEVGELLDYLLTRGVDVDALADDDEFVTAVLTASQIALGTSLESKMRRLRNFLGHMALDPTRRDFTTMRLLRLVEELEDEHFALLAWARDPDSWNQDHGIQPDPGLGNHLDTAALGLSDEVFAMVAGDLGSRGLYRANINISVTADPTMAALVPLSPLGEALLEMVENFT